MQEACAVTDLIMVCTRAAMLLLAAASGPYAIHLGARMYQQMITSRGSTELSGMGFKVLMKSAGPGLFLIGFGSFLLLAVISRQLVMSDSQGPATRPSSAVDVPPRASMLLVQAPATKPADPAPPPCNCIVYSRQRAFASGADPLDRAVVQANLALAIEVVRRAGAAGVADPRARAELLVGLETLREATTGQR